MGRNEDPRPYRLRDPSESGRYGQLAACVRRLHDTGRSGWWYFLAILPYIGGIALFIIFCLKSDEDNKYGPKPKTGMIER